MLAAILAAQSDFSKAAASPDLYSLLRGSQKRLGLLKVPLFFSDHERVECILSCSGTDLEGGAEGWDSAAEDVSGDAELDG